MIPVAVYTSFLSSHNRSHHGQSVLLSSPSVHLEAAMKTLTIEQTLHPEFVDSGDENSGSPWETFFREARGDIPIDIAEPVHEDLVATNVVTEDHFVNAEVVVSAKQDDDGFPPTPVGQEEPRRQRTPGKGCFYLEGLIGGVLTLAVTLIVFSLELAGAIVYVLAVGFNVFASDERITPGLIKAIISLVVHTLMLTDSVCLFCSVIVSLHLQRMIIS